MCLELEVAFRKVNISLENGGAVALPDVVALDIDNRWITSAPTLTSQIIIRIHESFRIWQVRTVVTRQSSVDA